MVLDMISYMISCMISDIMYIKMHFPYFLCPAAADPRPAQHVDETNDDREPDRPMDFDEERDYADQGPNRHGHGGRHRDYIPTAPYPNHPNPVKSFNFKSQDRFRLDGGRPGVVCLPSTFLQLHLVSDRPQGVWCAQCLAQGGIPVVFQLV